MTPPLPTLPSRPDDDLDAQILRVEQRLVAREQRLCHGAAGLARDARRTLKPQRLALPVASAVLGAVALVSLLRRPAAMPPPARPVRTGALQGLPLMQLVGLAWPLLPERWRDRIGPATATTVLTLGLPLLQRLLGGPPKPPLTPVAAVDLGRVTGRWFLVGELGTPLQPPPGEPPEFGLLPRDDGQLDLLTRRIDARGAHGSEARVDPLPGSHGARWRVSHWPEVLRGFSWAWSEMAVLHVDEAGSEMLLGDAARDTLWLLAREPRLDASRRQALVQQARDQGFDLARWYTWG
jgi:apolipoprotein D and lipocalin family protein